MPIPEIGINDVLIRVHRTGICGTDLHIYQWDQWAQKNIPVPMIVGHEFVGEIVRIGENVSDFFPGRDRQRGKGMSSADDAATASRGVGIFARTPAASGSTVPVRLRNIWRCR